jgi:arylsulfatase A-like enzyme
MSKRVSRRKMMLAAGAGVPLATYLLNAQAQPPRPNIIYIMADDMGYADVSCYGRQEYQTPNIDRLAREGVKLTHCYANSAVCSATRTGLITGRYQYRLRVGLDEPLGNPNLGMPPEHPTLPSLIKKAGYETGLIGKWHLGRPPMYSPIKSGYDHFWGIMGGGVDYFTHSAAAGPNAKEDTWDGEVQVHEAGYYTDLLGNHAVDYIKKMKQPYLLSLHFTAPHWPWEGPGDEAESKRLTNGIQDYDGGSMKTYAAMVTRMDYQIGRVLDTLQTTGQAANTIVIFTSDNGGERFANTWPFTGKKTELLEGGLRVPGLVRWPGHIKPGTVTDQVAISMDWTASLLAAAGAAQDPAYPMDGMDIFPILTGARPTVDRKLFWRYKFNAQQALRDGKYKYLKIRDNTFLFDVVEDPLERANLKNRLPDIYARMSADYERWNATMLPLVPESPSGPLGYGDVTADHFGMERPRRANQGNEKQ